MTPRQMHIAARYLHQAEPMTHEDSHALAVVEWWIRREAARCTLKTTAKMAQISYDALVNSVEEDRGRRYKSLYRDVLDLRAKKPEPPTNLQPAPEGSCPHENATPQPEEARRQTGLEPAARPGSPDAPQS